MKLKYLIFTALLALAGNAFAINTSGPGSNGMHPHTGSDRCKADPGGCKQDAAKFDKWCAANADKCEAVKAWNEHRIEACRGHENDCADHMRRVHEHLKQWCAKNSTDEMCKNMKDRENDQDSDEGMPPPR